MQKIPDFTQIDTEEGLSRVGGDAGFYLELLTSLHQEFKDAPERYIRQKETDAWEDARILVHSLKGVSGNLGAKTLHTAAAVLEDAIKAGDYEEAAAKESPFFNAHAQLMEELDRSGILVPDEGEKERIPEATLRESLELIAENAARKKAGPCKNALKEISSYAWPESLSGELADLTDALKKYKLPDAAAIAGTILKTLN